MQWDEEKLKETEKFRGQFQKIDEPKTPYRPNEEVQPYSSRAMRRWTTRAKPKMKSLSRSP